MKKWMNAKIKWLTEDEGGRRNPIPIISHSHERNDNRYCPIIIFPDSIINGQHWSADIYVKSYNSVYESMAKISYLSDKAPFELLQEGVSFELYEGNKKVAIGVFQSELNNSFN